MNSDHYEDFDIVYIDKNSDDYTEEYKEPELISSNPNQEVNIFVNKEGIENDVEETDNIKNILKDKKEEHDSQADNLDYSESNDDDESSVEIEDDYLDGLDEIANNDVQIISIIAVTQADDNDASIDDLKELDNHESGFENQLKENEENDFDALNSLPDIMKPNYEEEPQSDEEEPQSDEKEPQSDEEEPQSDEEEPQSDEEPHADEEESKFDKDSLLDEGHDSLHDEQEVSLFKEDIECDEDIECNEDSECDEKDDSEYYLEDSVYDLEDSDSMFDEEDSDSMFDEEEPDSMFDEEEPDSMFDEEEPDSMFDDEEPNSMFDEEEPNSMFDEEDSDSMFDEEDSDSMFDEDSDSMLDEDSDSMLDEDSDSLFDEEEQEFESVLKNLKLESHVEESGLEVTPNIQDKYTDSMSTSTNTASEEELKKVEIKGLPVPNQGDNVSGSSDTFEENKFVNEAQSFTQTDQKSCFTIEELGSCQKSCFETCMVAWNRFVQQLQESNTKQYCM